MRVDAAVLAHAGLTARTQRSDDAAARGSAPADEANARTAVTAAEETLAGQTSQTDTDPSVDQGTTTATAENGVRFGQRRRDAESPFAGVTPDRDTIAAIQEQLGIGRFNPQQVARAEEQDQAAAVVDLTEEPEVETPTEDPEPTLVEQAVAAGAEDAEETSDEPAAGDVARVRLGELDATINPNNIDEVQGLPEIRLGGGSVPGGTAALLHLLATYEPPVPLND